MNNQEKKYELIKFEDGEFSLDVNVSPNDETVWLSQRLMAELFQKDVRTINEHILNVFAENELPQDFSTIRNFRIVQNEGGREVSREISFSVITPSVPEYSSTIMAIES